MTGASSLSACVVPRRLLADLRELAELTSDSRGAQRVCWTPTWMAALDWFRGKAAEVGAATRTDEAGNVWATLAGAVPDCVVVGSHLDSVPDGGWLDGSYGVAAGLELLRAAAAGPSLPVTLALVAFADEEGARFGPSLGSAGAVGAAEPAWAALRDRDGVTLGEAAAACGVEVAGANAAAAGFDPVRAYLEIHVEQGPVLEDSGVALAVVTGTVAMRRERLRLRGTANHAAATPMPLRRDALAVAAETIVAVRDAAAATGDATGTVAELQISPNVWSVVAEDVELIVDMRARAEEDVERMYATVRATAADAAERARVRLEWEFVRGHGAQPFDAGLVALAEQACGDVGVRPLRLVSGAMHDATVIATRAPAVLLFVPSSGGVSHSAAEDTPVADLELGVLALSRLLERVLEGAA